MSAAQLGHGDHWLAALTQDDPRLRNALTVPVDAPAGLALHRAPLTDALDMVQVTRARQLVTAYPEPRATALVRGIPRELQLWENRAEGWLTFEHETAGVLTVFLTDLAEAAPRYAAAGTRSGIDLELAGIAYRLERGGGVAEASATSRGFVRKDRGGVAGGSAAKSPPRIERAARTDLRFLPDDYSFDGVVHAVHRAQEGEVADLEFHGGLAFPVTAREASLIERGDRARGYLWLTARLPS